MLFGRSRRVEDKSDDFASPSAAGRHMRVPTARDMRWTTPGKSSRHRMSQETVTGWFPSLLPGRRRAAAGWSKELRWIGKYVPWPTDKVGGMRRLMVNRRAAGCDPAMSKNRFDASFIYLEIVGVLSPYGELNYEHQCASVAALQNLFCITCSLCSAFGRRERRRETRMSSPS
ncbi:hypothetical protein EVAR_22435_1 [Eumeta japonica]|uniref:Uncharacterized protein n=1 Tax=Eumeta variegata TaxID=151549 RepID=A0A4C1ZSY9_EUMVA|nr:hypothetical protein EVAR_22435_1 [Eumeta japonica]